ncbi:hypothetical protein F2Q69_00024459 [Brassica cretica]|uniref:Uncharacterized protein n=1 Tax=Brassica cretica TaxID=69181 RepID=A0A8S9Q7Z6_BRACR|nr:hypothetical protein F2Q69_00024459 [Brassica cretica]
MKQKFYDTVGGIDKSFKQRSRHSTRPLSDVYVPTSVDRQPEFGRRAFDVYSTENSTGKRRMSMESTEMIRDV